MKKRDYKKFFIIVLILFISIGFAYLSTNMNLKGTGIFKENSWDIYFDNLIEESYKTEITSAATIDSKTTIDFSINLKQPKSSYTMYANIVNDGSIDAMLDSFTINNTLDENEEKAIDIKVSYSDGVELTKYDLLKAKKSDYIKVSVIYKDSISNSELLTDEGNLDFSLTLNYLQADEDAKERVFKSVSIIKSLNTEGTSISTTDYYGELRFIGANPNNYVSFNNQIWRIIGVFDGKLKLIQDSIGDFSWDTSSNNVNNGWGVNQWGPSTNEDSSAYAGADLMKLLNPGYEDNSDLLCNSIITTNESDQRICGEGIDSNYTTYLVNNSLYWNADSGFCYSDGDYGIKSCDFSSIGLKDELSKSMIDDYIWKLGSLDVPSEDIWDGRVKANLLYNWERSTSSGKQCSNATYCSDTVNRTVEWTGKVGLMYPSDWVYATGGGTEGRDDCLSKNVGYVNDSSIKNWSNTYTTCYQDNWLHSSYWQYTMTPRAHSSHAGGVFFVYPDGGVYNYAVRGSAVIRPVVYLKSNVILTNVGNGTQSNPFELKIS